MEAKSSNKSNFETNKDTINILDGFPHNKLIDANSKSYKNPKCQKSVRKIFKSSLRNTFNRKLKILDGVICVISFIIVVLTTCENELFYNEKYEEGIKIKKRNESDIICNSIRWIILFLAIGEMVFIIWRYIILMKVEICNLTMTKYGKY